MASNPEVFNAAQEFLQLYVFGDASQIHGDQSPGDGSKVPGNGKLKFSSGAISPMKPVQGLRRRQPAVQGPPLEFVALDRDPGVSDDPTVAVIDMCAVEDFLLVDGANNLTLVLFWCTDYPSSALSDELPGLGKNVRVQVPVTVEAQAIALECIEHLQAILGDDFDALDVQYQIELAPFEQLAAAKAAVVANPPP